MTFSSITAFAATTILNYDGTGIGAKMSVNSFTLFSTTTVTINHTISAWTGVPSGSTPTLKIQVYKKNLTGAYTTIGNEFQKTGTESTSKSYSLGNDNYKLYFYTSHSTTKANINVYVTK
ncbi:hypothetical protein [Clostridium sp.]|uniref:hypothetical protein n=1 Tax=Clostridium sp. TaxID=1506 RepID=UPI001B6E85FA|nr:hypothetical protein [Clostridium sp.]MBP3916893.1 hypothetical protein [Clostridium sp.]MBQ5696404.1 hypothetical protein [Clostridium sp.]